MTPQPTSDEKLRVETKPEAITEVLQDPVRVRSTMLLMFRVKQVYSQIIKL